MPEPTTTTSSPMSNASKPCQPMGHLHCDFGGDVSKFGEAQQNELTKKLRVALNLTEGELMVTRHTDAEEMLNTGALGHGKIFHPTKVQLHV